MMTKTIKLECGHELFHGLTVALDKVRATSRTVTVNKEALAALMRDHGRVLARLDNGVDYAEADD